MKINPTLIELMAGIIFFGIVCQIAGIFLADDQVIYAVSLWIGIAAALGIAYHMNYTIDRALDYDEETAAKITRSAYLLRFGLVFILLGCLAVFKIGNFLIAFLGIMGLKIGAYIQPFTHKIAVGLFHTESKNEALQSETSSETDVEAREESAEDNGKKLKIKDEEL